MKKNKHQSDKSPKDLLNKAKMIMSSIQTKILLLNEQEPEKETLGQKKDDLIIDSPKEDSIETFVKEYKQNIENKCTFLIDILFFR